MKDGLTYAYHYNHLKIDWDRSLKGVDIPQIVKGNLLCDKDLWENIVRRQRLSDKEEKCLMDWHQPDFVLGSSF